MTGIAFAILIGALVLGGLLCFWGMARWPRSSPVVTGAPGTAYMCPEHGRFVPAELPRYNADRPEAKCKAWLPGDLTYCGRYCPEAADGDGAGTRFGARRGKPT
jgi:hypothetical protein